MSRSTLYGRLNAEAKINSACSIGGYMLPFEVEVRVLCSAATLLPAGFLLTIAFGSGPKGTNKDGILRPNAVMGRRTLRAVLPELTFPKTAAGAHPSARSSKGLIDLLRKKDRNRAPLHARIDHLLFYCRLVCAD